MLKKIARISGIVRRLLNRLKCWLVSVKDLPQANLEIELNGKRYVLVTLGTASLLTSSALVLAPAMRGLVEDQSSE